MTESSNCKYHPTLSASWYCKYCEVNFCNSCVPKDEKEYMPRCTLCRRSLDSLSIAEMIPPFWEKLGSLLLIPFSKAPLTIVCLFAVIFSVLPFGTVGAILFLLCLIPLVEFLFAAMEHIASGEKLKLKVSEFMTVKNKSFFLKSLAAYILIVILITKLSAISTGLGYFLSAFFILGVPASLIILMMEKSMFNMLSPVKIGYIIKVFGKAYFILYAAMLLVAYLGVVSASMMASEPSFFKQLLINGGILYLTMTVFLMAGYLVYQYHRELNFTVNRQTLFDVSKTVAADPLAEVNIFIQEGRFEDAQTLLLDLIGKNPANHIANEKLILLYAIQGNFSFMEKVAQPYFKELVKNKKTKQASDFYRKLNKKRIAFIPETIDVVVAIANEMKNKADFNIAIELIDNFLTVKKMPSGWELLYFVYAQILIEFSNKLPEAKEKLTTIINRGLDQDVMEKAEKYMKAFG